MTPPATRRAALYFLRATALSALLMASTAPALAGPGAHGPNGEHLDGPTPTRLVSALPRVAAHTDAFELVAELRKDELVILVDRYASNEPVLGATLEVESGAHKAVAAFRAEQGDYAVTDTRMIAALAAPGEHGLVFTLLAGQDSDLLDGTLVTARAAGAAAAAGHEHGHEHELQRNASIGAGLAALGLLGGFAWWRRRRRTSTWQQGGV